MQRALADQIDSEISSRMEDFLQSSGTGANEQIRQRSEDNKKRNGGQAHWLQRGLF